MPSFTRIIWVLAWVSLLTDMASEMLYPVIPLYLQQIGFTVAGIGWMEGTVQFLAGVSKGYFGKQSDELGKRLPFIQWGYTLSALSKPLMGWLTHPLWILGVRGVDRLGKGMRTAPRDAWLAQEAGPHKATVFGFHRSMDTWGAAIGPLLALIYLLYRPGDYATLFLLAFAPGLLSVGLLLTLREKTVAPKPSVRTGFFGYLHNWEEAPASFKKMVPALLLFALFNHSDIFLLLMARQAIGNSSIQVLGTTIPADAWVIGAYILYNAVYALTAYPIGRVAERIGTRIMIVGGFIFFAGVYAGFGMGPNTHTQVLLFCLYGLYAAATEGMIKAWISEQVPMEKTGTAIGFYTSLESVSIWLASGIAGMLWTFGNPSLPFYLSAAVALGVALYLYLLGKLKTQ
ncbi:MAG: MFS transporter [Bacteroidetes bacterium]|nr:MFS transporter [Bacteroidota bacterium]